MLFTQPSHYPNNTYSSTEHYKCVNKYPFSAILNRAFSFIKLLISDGSLLKILIPVYYALFWKHERLAVGLCRPYLCFVLRLCTSASVWKSSTLFVMKFISEYIYSHGIVKICSLLNKFLQGLWDLTPIMSLTCNRSTFCCQMIYPRKLFLTSLENESK
jgi:hypothetical protein